ncbi:MAG: hypothetical protein FJY86_01665 [Candidatus Diapherotrites archaeon]|uniref:DUF2207 domain-containing protein n=1 Tax=Candidatus Iainarchaeum sp. TaxID=3101447 RepID=A0A8T4C6K1_9ARCH|nr:hypothetical protein [Candidatus Diapherotrites archaeon]
MPAIPPSTNPSGSEPSIIEIIQSMVREGESEQKILQTLQQLGVEPQKAQRLLLLAQADTFALLRSEISKIVKQDLESEKQNMNAFVQQQAQSAVQSASKNLSENVKKDLESYENQLSMQRRNFETETKDTLTKFTDLAERIRVRVNELGKDVQQVKVDQDEIKLRGVGNQNRMISIALLAFGVLFVLADLFLFIVNFGSVLTIDSVIIFIVMALIGVVLMFVATLV